MSANTLISTAKPSDSGLHAALHPLVLLTISDYITRHTLRRQTQPIIGALLGQQNGREITIEHAYDVKLLESESEQQEWKLHESWFADRLQQYKLVHKAPALDLVGWWTLSPLKGPGSEVLGIHQYIMQTYNESALILAFHPEAVLEGSQVEGKLPLTIYESVYESNRSVEGGDEEMQVEGEEVKNRENLDLRLKELTYEVVTGEAEMISVDFVARGGGNATAIEDGSKDEKETQTGKGKERDQTTESNGIPTETQLLNSEEEELLSFLSTRANAVHMLQSRLHLLKSYLSNLPPSHLSDSSLPVTPATADTPPIPYSNLRAILALTARLPLLVPSSTSGFSDEQAAEHSDVALVALLGGIGKSVQEAKDLGRVFSVVESGRKEARKGGGAGGGGMTMMGGLGMNPGAGWEQMGDMEEHIEEGMEGVPEERSGWDGMVWG